MGQNPQYSPLTGRAYQTGQVSLPQTVGTELVAVDNGGATVVNVPVAALSTDCLLATAVTANSSTSSTTLTAANMTATYGDVILPMSGTLAAAANAQLPTVAALVANLLGATAPTNGAFTFTLANRSSGNFAWTITTNTGWTLNGAASTFVVPQYQYSTFLVQFTSQTTATITQANAGFLNA